MAVRCACGYEVTEVADVCPQCGDPLPLQDAKLDETTTPVGNGPDTAISPDQAASASPAAPDAEPARAGYIPGADIFSAGRFGVTLSVMSPLGNRELHLESGEILQIGRTSGPLTDLCTDNISGTHAEIRVEAHGIRIRDVGTNGAGSTNGTFVNGVRIQAGRLVDLADGDVVTCATDPALRIDVVVEK